MKFDMKTTLPVALIGLIASAAICAASVSDYDVVWDSPSEDCHGSMPIGNGDIGANVWVEPNGDLIFYLSKTDAIDAHARFVKVGRLRVRLTPGLFTEGGTFRKRLDLENGVITINTSSGTPAVETELRFWVDANHPVVRITGKSTAETVVEVINEPWRTERTEAVWDRSFTGLGDRQGTRNTLRHPGFIEPDTLVPGRTDSMVWYHCNNTAERSVWADTLKAQGLEGFKEQASDPLHHLTYGALVRGAGLASQSPTVLKSTAPAEKELYQRLLKATPDLPKAKTEDGQEFLLPAETGAEKRRNNCEKPECYAIFPFRLYGVGLAEGMGCLVQTPRTRQNDHPG